MTTAPTTSAPTKVAPRTPERPAAAHRPPEPDKKLRETTGGSASGWLAIGVVLVALAGCALAAATAGLLPGALAERLPLSDLEGRFDGEPWPWAALAAFAAVAVVTAAGLARGAVGSAWVLTSFGRYRGTVRRTGLVWINPFVLRRRVDVRLKHWRSEPVAAVDAEGNQLRVVVLVVWRVKDTARAALGVADCAEYLRDEVESVLARVLSRLPADAYARDPDTPADAPTLRDTEAVGSELTALLRDECRAVGLDIYSVQPTRIEYAPEVAAVMHRRQVAALDAKHRDTVLSSVIDSVAETVARLTSRGLVELDDYERKALVKDLTVAFYSGRSAET